MSVRARSTTLIGIEAVTVDVEAHLIQALRRFAIVGLPDGVVREAKDRVKCAIQNSGLFFPSREVIVSLGPASVPKFGARFDLAIALSILAADKQLDPRTLNDRMFLGELALNGQLKPVPGELASALELKRSGGGELIVPDDNARFISHIEGIEVVGVSCLLEALAYLQNRIPRKIFVQGPQEELRGDCRLPTFKDVVGQQTVKRALEVAAAGGHNVMMIGPPGAGKSMLARRVPSILPPLTKNELLEVRKVYSAGGAVLIGQEANTRIYQRPFRAPHHTTSTAGLVGGGSMPLPGEISLAHRGVLFLDEFAELRRDTMESLREPLEMQRISISRAKLRICFPADFMLIAAMNPCPCGKSGGSQTTGGKAGQRCACTPQAVQRYQTKLSGPIADRIDIHLWVPAVPLKELAAPLGTDPTEGMRERVIAARRMQAERLGNSDRTNARLSAEQIRRFCKPDSEGRRLLEKAAEQFDLSARGYTRLLKVGRSIADLAGSETIKSTHIMEALSYRRLNLAGR